MKKTYKISAGGGTSQMLADWMTSLKTSKAFLREMQKPLEAGIRGNSGKVMSKKNTKEKLI